VNVAAGGAGYININAITINNPGTGYTVGDVITIDNENNLPGTFQIGVAANNWTFGTDGSLASNEFKIKTLDGIPNSINTPSITDTQLWDYNYGSDLATTGGTGTGLKVNVSDAGSGYASIAINVPGTGYSPGDIITVTNGPFNGAGAGSSATFIIGVSGTRSWTFDRYGALTFPNSTVQSTAYLAPTTGNNVISSAEPLTISRNGMTIRVTSAGMIQMSFNSVISITGRSSINNADSAVISSPNGATTSGTWYNIGAVLAAGDHLTATIADSSFHRIYRLTAIIREKGTTPGSEFATAYAIIEQLQ
jgi:hypothetical protein